ncbi:MAG: helix-hairpin-helix domain-containing protein [Clostridia bacterium]|nr:helix-hairpin-helix domain-containing protein [Clostridia bacterium]
MMKRRIGMALLLLAAAALVCCIRLPAARRSVTMTASGAAVKVEPIPIKRGEVPVNTADAALLDTLPGIGEGISQEIIAEREADGPFFYPEDLMQVKGIGDKRLEAIYDMLDLASGETGG